MDEILIEEKKYISSKQAAKITGYAKDYIGQLCREGRVPARLVGRAWYVLESAIQDHRFGEETAHNVMNIPTQNNVSSARYESASRYETVQEDEVRALPPLNRLQTFSHLTTETVTAAPKIEQKPKEELPNTPKVEETTTVGLQESWEDLFNKPAPLIVTEPRQEDESQVAIPIHILNPTRAAAISSINASSPTVSITTTEAIDTPATAPVNGYYSRMLFLGKLALVLVAVASVAISTVGSGYFDTYLISNTRGGSLLGVTIYEK